MTDIEELRRNAENTLALQGATLRPDGKYDLKYYVAEITDKVNRVPGLGPALSIIYVLRKPDDK